MESVEVENSPFVSGKESASDHPHILIVDDSPELLSVLGNLLLTQGYCVTASASAEEALVQLKVRTPDLILCDVMMPDIDGFVFHSKLKAHPEWCHIPFVFLSALSDSKNIQEGKRSGCDDYLTKPFCLDELQSAIRGKLELARSRREKRSEQFNSYRKKIVHTLSHELRTPLVAINTGTELLLERANSHRNPAIDDQFIQLLETVQRGGLRMQRLVEDFMSLHQIETGSAANVAARMRERGDLREIAQEALELYSDLTLDPSILVEFIDKSFSEQIYVNVYAAQIHNIIVRVLENAHKFAGKSSLVSVVLSSSNSHASITIRDRGPGLPEKLVENACKLFTQIDRERLEQQGCGLGLTIATFYARYNSGELLFRTPDDGLGLEVELKLPRSLPRHQDR